MAEEIPAANIAAAARRLNELRENWLNPPEWTERIPEVVPGYPDRIVAKPGHEAELKKRTLTNLYNARPAWLDNAHKALDAAVAAAYAETLNMRDAKIAELSRAFEASKVEREELAMHERERLQRLYAEKEKALDEDLAAREAELLRTREALAKASADRDAAQQMRQSQEDSYRKTLEEFRSKLSEALLRFEVLQKTAEERQAFIASLQMELSQERKRSEEQAAGLAARLAAKEKDFRDVRSEYADFKSAFDAEIQETDKKYTDAMQKLRSSEEQRVAKDKQLEQYKREGDFWRMEIARKGEEVAALEKEKLKELSALKDSLNAKDIAMAQLQSKCDTLARSEERLRVYVEEEKTQRAMAEVKAEEAIADAAKKAEEFEKTRQLVEQLKEKFKVWKNK